MLHAILRGRTACSLTHSRHATHTRTHDQRASLISSHSDTGINDLTELDVSENCAPALQPRRSCGSCASCRAVPVPGQRSPRRRRLGLVRSAADRSCPVAQCFSTCVCVCVSAANTHITHAPNASGERGTLERTCSSSCRAATAAAAAAAAVKKLLARELELGCTHTHSYAYNRKWDTHTASGQFYTFR